MSEYVEIENCKNQYIGFETKGNMCAASIEHINGIVQFNQDIPYAIPPRASKYVKCIAMLGNDIVTVIEMPEISGKETSSENYIVILNYVGKKIGVLAHGVHLITASEKDITEDKITGAKTIMYNEIPYLFIDISKFFEYIGA